jgi:hypothetical protein
VIRGIVGTSTTLATLAATVIVTGGVVGTVATNESAPVVPRRIIGTLPAEAAIFAGGIVDGIAQDTAQPGRLERGLAGAGEKHQRGKQ